MDKSKGLVQTARDCDTAFLVDLTPAIEDFYKDILYLLLGLICITLVAVILILWDLLSLLFTPIVKVLSIGSYVSDISKEDALPQRMAASEEMVALARQLSGAESSWLYQLTDDDVVHSQQFSELCICIWELSSRMARQV